MSKISIGADCIKQLSQQTRQMTGDDFIQWLNASEEKLPAICQSGHDAVRTITIMEEMCTELKSNCTVEMKEVIRALEYLMPLNEL